MKQRILVVSDVHLGGEPGPDGLPGFQICPAANQARLVSFLDAVPDGSDDQDVRLVINGDLVDFLAEKPFTAFTSLETEAAEKLKNIMKRTRAVWDALAAFVSRGGSLTLLLGNHDIEMSLPAVRRVVLDTLGNGLVEFIYDNEAFTIGPVLIEHGNRADSWNLVPYGALRRVRSQLSRRIAPAPPFVSIPGSRLVVEVMNRLKTEYSFVDLLKPEGAASLPILAALGAGSLKDVYVFAKQFRNQMRVEYDEEMEPTDETYIAATSDEEQRLYNLAQDIAAGGDATQIAERLSLEGLRESVGEPIRKLRRDGLRRWLQETKSRHQRAFDTNAESKEYLQAANAAHGRGYKCVVFGHTHLAKQIENGDRRYLNAGTWADLMCVPRAIWGESHSARAVLDSFVNDLEADHVGAWRRSAPTYADIEVDGERIVSANVRFADTHEALTTKGLMERLDPALQAHGAA